MTILKVVAGLVASSLREDDRRVALGEDVADGGMLGLSRSAREDESLRGQLWSTPLTNDGLWAHAIGIARGGRRPLVLPASGADLSAAAAVLTEGLARRPGAVGHGGAPGLLVVTVTGAGFGVGGSSAASVEADLVRIVGLRVVVAGDASELPALFRALEREDQPTALLIPRSLALLVAEDFREAADPARANVRRSGQQATVFAWGGALARAELAIEALADRGRDVGLVDVRSLSPLDEPTLMEAARATGRLLIVHGGPRSFGVGAELAARFADEAILSLDAPIVRVTGHGTAEATALPTVEAIADAIERVVTY